MVAPTSNTTTSTSMSASAPSQRRMAVAEKLELDEDWEEWDPSKGSFAVHAASGSLAGLAEHCFVYPIDTFKTHLQTRGSNTEAFRAAVRAQGIGRLFRGVSTMFTGCIPAHALYFSIYEKGKSALGVTTGEHHPLRAAVVGATATVAHDLVMNPMDVIKQRLQLGYYSGMLDCARSIARTEGIGALFASLPTTLVMNIPYAAIMVGTNESMKTILNPNDEPDVASFLISGCVAGAVAATATNPFDVVKTRLQTQTICCEGQTCAREELDTRNLKPRSQRPTTGSGSTFKNIADGSMRGNRGVFAAPTAPGTVRGVWDSAYKCRRTVTRQLEAEGGASTARYKGMIDTATRIYREEGAQGFARGLKPRLLVHGPAAAISWTTYEFCKRFLASFDS